MTLSLDFGARSDVGMQRQDNQDSLYAGPGLLAVADGVGGAAHGEIASRLAISALMALDGTATTDPNTSLQGAAEEADASIRETVGRHPSFAGMSTTLTAILVSGDQVTLAHIGDSRAYLLRNGRVEQLTHDHTLVQSLVDDGQITEEEALVHPRRSWILRALDGRGSPELDLAPIGAQPGDRLLVCSDGLSSYVDGAVIARALAGDDPQTAAGRLVDLALRAGGSDNISCAVADVTERPARDQAPIIDGAIAEPEPEALHTTEVGAEAGVDESEPADRISHAAPRRSIGRRLAIVASIVVILIAAGVAITAVYIHHQWYVAPEAGKVAVFQGVQGNAAGVKLSHRKVLTDIPVTALPQDDREHVTSGIQASGGKTGAESVVANLRQDACNLATTTAAPLITTTPKVTPTPQSTKSTGTKGHLPHSDAPVQIVPTFCSPSALASATSTR